MDSSFANARDVSSGHNYALYNVPFFEMKINGFPRKFRFERIDSTLLSGLPFVRIGHTDHEVKALLKFFLLGAAGYPLLELLYRRRTHYSMSLAGGVSACILAEIQKLPFRRAIKGFLGALCITGIEYAAGCIWNRKYRVWDYRHLPFNYRGQVCLHFSLIWGALCYSYFYVLDHIDLQAASRNSRDKSM